MSQIFVLWTSVASFATPYDRVSILFSYERSMSDNLHESHLQKCFCLEWFIMNFPLKFLLKNFRHFHNFLFDAEVNEQIERAVNSKEEMVYPVEDGHGKRHAGTTSRFIAFVN